MKSIKKRLPFYKDYKRLKRMIKDYPQVVSQRDQTYEKLYMLMEQAGQITFGSSDWLTMTELKYGGYVTNVPRHAISDQDKRNQKISTGGDRMSAFYHNYAPRYAEYLQPLVSHSRRVVLAEIGILRGTGLAIWSDLFPTGRIIGMDIDLVNTESNMPNLKSRGAFKNNNIELHKFDQFKDDDPTVSNILKGDKIDIVIDDGVHLDETIIKSYQATKNHLADDFVYIIEDNKTVHSYFAKLNPQLNVDYSNRMTILTPKK
jgi:hypothetical protein